MCFHPEVPGSDGMLQVKGSGCSQPLALGHVDLAARVSNRAGVHPFLPPGCKTQVTGIVSITLQTAHACSCCGPL